MDELHCGHHARFSSTWHAAASTADLVSLSYLIFHYSHQLTLIINCYSLSSAQMIDKIPRKRFLEHRKVLKYFLFAEGLLFLSSYFAWGACNRSQKARKFFHDTPGLGFVLEFYYRLGELRGESFRVVRQFDQITWAAERELLQRENPNDTSGQ